MPIHVVRLGDARQPGEGTRLGTVRRPPRGVPKRDFSRLDYYDVWVPELAPSAQLVSWAHLDEWSDARWLRYAKQYRREMNAPHARRLLELLAAMSRDASFAVGCYCADEWRCHRSLLRELLDEAGAEMA